MHSVPNSGKKKKKSESSRSKPESERLRVKEDEFNLNLTVCGSSAPICYQQPKSAKTKKNPILRKKREERKFESPLPLEKIILLAEKLNIKNEDCTELSSFLPETFDEEKQTEKNGFFLESQKPSEDFQQDFNFYLDISSLSTTNDESEESSSDVESEVQRKEENSSNGLGGEPFASYPCAKNSQPQNILPRVFDTQRSLVPPAVVDHSFPNSRESSFSGCESHGSRKSSRRSCGSDLICLYVNAVNNQNDLLKFFRPCRSCQETCCVCERTSRSEKQGGSSRDFPEKEDKSVETDDNVTFFRDSVSLPSPCLFERQKTPQSFPSCRSCPEPSVFSFCPLENEQGNCYYCKDCCCRCRGEVDWLQSSDQNILAYAYSLANAAKSARTLARDLESVLSTFKNGIGFE